MDITEARNTLQQMITGHILGLKSILKEFGNMEESLNLLQKTDRLIQKEIELRYIAAKERERKEILEKPWVPNF